MITHNHTKSLLILYALSMPVNVISMQPPQPATGLASGPTMAGQSRAGTALSDFSYNGASVLPYTKWPSKTDNYFLLAREKGTADKGTYDAFGGAKDHTDTFTDPKTKQIKSHPINTAAREFYEESLGLFGSKDAIMKHIEVEAGKTTNTAAVIANANKQYVVYISYFPSQAFDNFKKQFYTRPLGEKDRIAHVKESNLRQAIANAPRVQGQLVTPIKVWATVFEPNGTEHPEQIQLRPVFVSTLQSYFQGNPGTLGKVDRIHFY